MEGHQPKKKSIGILHPKYGKLKLSKSGFELEKNETHKYGKLPNGITLVKPTDRPAPPPPQKIKDQRVSNIWMNNSILCHSCKNKDICKYQGDYLEQVVHIIDVYDGVFDLNCNNYKAIKAIHVRYDDKVLYEKNDIRCI